MGYHWPGMSKIEWDEVKEMIKDGSIVGCFKLYDDDTEGMIEQGYDLDDLYEHHLRGGEFGSEIPKEKTHELCPYCGKEVLIENIGVSICPECSKVIVPCNMCNECYSPCVYADDPIYQIARDKKKNAEYWDEIENKAEACVMGIAAHSICGVKEQAEEMKVDLGKKIVEMVTSELERLGGVFPYVDEDM